MYDKLIIGINHDKENGETVVTVKRQRRGEFEVLNEIYADEARKLYRQLTGRKLK